MAYSEAQKRASMKYNEKAYDRLVIRVKKGEKEIIEAYAKSQGKSINEFVNECIKNCIK